MNVTAVFGLSWRLPLRGGVKSFKAETCHIRLKSIANTRKCEVYMGADRYRTYTL